MTARDYPITQPYGYDPDYPLNNGFHKGIDYGAPEGTPIVVNGMTIGLVGHTGAAWGAHLHLGKFVGGVVQDPGNGGFDLPNATVFDTGYDDVNGNFIRIGSGGALWVYCHLSQVNVKKGQVVEDMAQPIINNTNEARQIALEYGIEIAGNDPFLERACGSTVLEYRASLAGMVANTSRVNNERIAALQAQVADLTHKLELAQVSNPDSDILNNFGKALLALIKRLGLK